MCANGPLAWSVLAFNHAMIFHSYVPWMQRKKNWITTPSTSYVHWFIFWAALLCDLCRVVFLTSLCRPTWLQLWCTSLLCFYRMVFDGMQHQSRIFQWEQRTSVFVMVMLKAVWMSLSQPCYLGRWRNSTFGGWFCTTCGSLLLWAPT